jgi:hypothetical protein
MEEIESNGIKIYPLPDCDSDEDEDYKEQVGMYQLVYLYVFFFNSILFMFHNIHNRQGNKSNSGPTYILKYKVA